MAHRQTQETEGQNEPWHTIYAKNPNLKKKQKKDCLVHLNHIMELYFKACLGNLKRKGLQEESVRILVSTAILALFDYVLRLDPEDSKSYDEIVTREFKQ